MSTEDGWISFVDRMPEPRYDRDNPGPTHGAILVTNNISARDRWGKMSHVWLASMVHEHPDGPSVFNGRVLAEQGEITAFAQPGDMSLRGLTHWRPAVIEEWEMPVCCTSCGVVHTRNETGAPSTSSTPQQNSSGPSSIEHSRETNTEPLPVSGLVEDRQLWQLYLVAIGRQPLRDQFGDWNEAIHVGSVALEEARDFLFVWNGRDDE